MSEICKNSENQNRPAISDAEVKLTAIDLILSLATARSLSEGLRGRAATLLRRKLVCDFDIDAELIDEYVSCTEPDAVEKAAIKLIVLDKTTRSLMGMKRWKVERLFKEKIS